MFSYPVVPYDGFAVIRGGWDDELLRECKRELDGATWQWNGKPDDARSAGKRFMSDLLPAAKKLVAHANRNQFVRWLEQLTGERELVPDLRLFGGGVHRIAPGGYLKMHRDFNWHFDLKLWRRINVLLYLNDWQPEWGGELCFSDHKVMPERNTMVVLTTDENAWHGHPEPLRCPEGQYRDSIALYYYSPVNPGCDKRLTTDYDA